MNARLSAAFAIVFLLAALAFSAAAAADEDRPSVRDSAPLFELTPFAGVRLGGRFRIDDPQRRLDVDDSAAFAMALDLRIDQVSQYELFYSRHSAGLQGEPLLGHLDVDIEYLHIGGTVAMEGENRRVIPYMVGGLGATRFSPDPAQAHDKTRFSASLGGGFKVPFNEHFALRLEGRGYVTLVDADTSFFCRSDGGAVCRIHGSGSTFMQFELLAGASFAF